MADPTTPDWDGQRAQINEAYNAALARLHSQQGDIYQQYGFSADGKHVDSGNQYGEVQQLLHSEGGELMAADDQAQEAGLGQYGLGAQRQALLRQSHGAAQAALFRQYQQGLGGVLGQQDAATFQHSRDLTNVDNNYANYNSQLQAQQASQAQQSSMGGWLQQMLAAMGGGS